MVVSMQAWHFSHFLLHGKSPFFFAIGMSHSLFTILVNGFIGFVPVLGYIYSSLYLPRILPFLFVFQIVHVYICSPDMYCDSLALPFYLGSLCRCGTYYVLVLFLTLFTSHFSLNSLISSFRICSHNSSFLQ